MRRWEKSTVLSTHGCAVHGHALIGALLSIGTPFEVPASTGGVLASAPREFL